MQTPKLTALKELCRSQVRRSLNRLNAPSRRLKSQKIADRLFRTAAFQKAEVIMVYISQQNEVSTRSMIQRALALQKRVYAPRTDRESGMIRAFEIRNPRVDLVKGPFGIMQPRARKSRAGSPQGMDLILVPGIAFDRKGHRLGRGGGYYDRFLQKARGAAKIGLAFRRQLIPRVPFGKGDVRVDCVITD